MPNSDLVVTGEGVFDRTSLTGKLVGHVVQICSDASVPVVVVAGAVKFGRRGADRVVDGSFRQRGGGRGGSATMVEGSWTASGGRDVVKSGSSAKNYPVMIICWRRRFGSKAVTSSHPGRPGEKVAALCICRRRPATRRR